MTKAADDAGGNGADASQDERLSQRGPRDESQDWLVAARERVRVFAEYDGAFEESADVVVVGSGPCGAVSAYELAAAGHDVILLEEGPPFTVRDLELDGNLYVDGGLVNNLPVKGQRKWRGMLLVPWVIPLALSTLGWWWMFDPTNSAFNYILQSLGFERVPFLSDPYWARFSVILVNVWYGAPFFLIMYLAALKSQPFGQCHGIQRDPVIMLAGIRIALGDGGTEHGRRFDVAAQDVA